MMTHKLHLLLALMQLQILRTWLDTNLDCSLTKIRSCNDHGAPPKWKQVSEIAYCMKYAIHKTPKKWIDGMKLKPEFLSVDVKTRYKDDNAVDGYKWRFINICKESCEDENVVEAYEKTLYFYHGQMKQKKTKAVNHMISSYQYVGLINVVGNLRHCTTRRNIAYNFLWLKEESIYSVKNFLVHVNKKEFRQIRVTMWGGLGDILIEKRTFYVGLYPIVLRAVTVKLYNNRLYLSSTSSTLIIDDEKIPVLKQLKTDDSDVELTKEMLPADNTTPKAGTLENLLMIDKVVTKKGWNYPSYGGEKCKKGNIARKAGQF
uniref:Replication protein A 70 kDa DNA-binding subunit C-like n=1 Tax=Tanacetum cinerariifolium TaxID=118510 RepID=A0A699GPN8_TANCI|nr:replication protein A 70 kDa DNA-binding subunit C-like [Tanacetum cinerariifolium]